MNRRSLLQSVSTFAYEECVLDAVTAEHQAAFEASQAQHEKTLASLEEEATSRARDVASDSHISELQQLRKQTEETISQVRHDLHSALVYLLLAMG